MTDKASLGIDDLDDVRNHFDVVRATFDPEKYPSAYQSLEQLAMAAGKAIHDREAIEEARVFAANVCAFLTRDGGTYRIDQTASGLARMAADVSARLARIQKEG